MVHIDRYLYLQKEEGIPSEKCEIEFAATVQNLLKDCGPNFVQCSFCFFTMAETICRGHFTKIIHALLPLIDNWKCGKDKEIRGDYDQIFLLYVQFYPARTFKILLELLSEKPGLLISIITSLYILTFVSFQDNLFVDVILSKIIILFEFCKSYYVI